MEEEKHNKVKKKKHNFYILSKDITEEIKKNWENKLTNLHYELLANNGNLKPLLNFFEVNH